MVLSRGYWRNMAQWDTWRLGWVALRRCHKDKRARKYIRRLLLMLSAPLLAPLLLLLLAYPPALIGFVIGAVRHERLRKKQEEEARAKFREPDPPPVTSALKTEIAELALLHALLANRAGSETFLRTKILPEGMEVITRREQIKLLREHGMYDRLDTVERDLLWIADGHWSQESIDDVALTLEPLRLLRWVLRIDHYLPHIGESLALDYKVANDTIADPGKLFYGEEFVGIQPLNNAFQASESIINRCFAEGVVRGMFTAKDEEQASRCRDIVAKMGKKEDEDIILGAKIVSEATDYDVFRARMLASRRSIVLRWVACRMYGTEPPNDTLRAFFMKERVTPAPDTE